jgi:hypothetical protein
MPMLHRAARVVVLLAATTALPGQEPAAEQGPPVRACVRDAATGLPFPGVDVRVSRRQDEEPHLVDGWLRRFGRRPAAATSVRSDPDGFLALAAADLRQPLAVAPRYRLVDDRVHDGERVLAVEPQPHHTVHVVDANGRSVADFALTARELHAVERTDASGLATFAARDARGGASPMPTFVPLHWIGPAGSTPAVTAAREARVTRMRLPPHVTLRVRLLRHGVPASTAVDAAWLTLPVERGLWSSREPPPAPMRPMEPVTCRGIEVGPIAWTGEVRGELRIGRLCVPFGSTTFPADGRVLELDVETDPPRPRLGGVVRATDGAAPKRVRVGAATDAGVFHDEVGVTPSGRIRASFDADWLRGTQLQRVWIDSLDPPGLAVDVTPGDMPLVVGERDLGDLVLAPHEPVLRGRVVDARGAPLPAAVVTVRPNGDAAGAPAVDVPVGDDGRFTLVGPRFRDGSGAAVPATASAVVTPRPSRARNVPAPDAASFRSPASPSTAHGGEVELVVPDAATGAFAMVVRGAPPNWRSQLQAQQVVDGKTSLLHDRRLATPDDASAWHAGAADLPVGRSRFRLLAMNQLLYELELDVAATRPSDPGAVATHAADFAALVRERSVRAVDENGRVLADARVHLRSNGHQSGVMPDDRGEQRWLEPLQLRHAAYLVAPGRQVIRLPESAAGDVTLPVAVPVALRVRNDDGSAIDGAWTAMLEPTEDTGLAVYGTVADDGTVRFPGPASGSYHVALFRDFNQFKRRVPIGKGTVADGQLAPAELSIDAAARTALRALQQEPPPRGK